jgi:hypothetical protein
LTNICYSDNNFKNFAACTEKIILGLSGEHMTDYRTHLSGLRKAYIEATPKQRLRVASQRISNPDHGPNLLVAYVSALEGFARCIAMHQEAHSKGDLSAIYPEYKHIGAEGLVERYLQKKIKKDAQSYFGQDVWEKIGFAIAYRNLLAHECTYLGQDTYPDLIQACEHVLQNLAELEGLDFKMA